MGVVAANIGDYLTTRTALAESAASEGNPVMAAALEHGVFLPAQVLGSVLMISVAVIGYRYVGRVTGVAAAALGMLIGLFVVVNNLLIIF